MSREGVGIPLNGSFYMVYTYVFKVYILRCGICGIACIIGYQRVTYSMYWGIIGASWGIWWQEV